LKDIINKRNVSAVKYEDFIAKTRKVISELFNLLNLEFDARIVDEEIRKDSQRGTPLCQDILNKYPPFVSQNFTAKDLEYLNNICEQLNLPHITEDIILPCTLGRD
jgi:tRNA(Ile)-lysidine synthase TilS/MesJ